MHNPITESESLKNIRKQSLEIANGDDTVLITGETGTGKGVWAQFIHQYSARARRKWATVNVPSIPRDLIAGELFGASRGAYTGCQQDRPGLFEMTNEGTLLLDEIGELDMDSQTKLLSVLEHKTVRRLGETRVRKVDVRVIAATNRDLRSAIVNGKFRDDLFYRLNVLPLHVPPLRDHKQDVGPLACHFLGVLRENGKTKATGFDNRASELLERYDWPGNIRELESVVKRAANVAKDAKVITAEHIGNLAGKEHALEQKIDMTLRQYLAQQRREFLRAAVKQHGSVANAAKAVGVHPLTIRRNV